MGKKFQPGNPGKPKGAVSKFTSLKADWLWVHNAIGGRKRLKAWAEKNDRNLTLFYQMETKLFPQEVKQSGEISHVLSFDFGENGGNGHEIV
jgi:hypothetical protein